MSSSGLWCAGPHSCQSSHCCLLWIDELEKYLMNSLNVQLMTHSRFVRLHFAENGKCCRCEKFILFYLAFVDAGIDASKSEQWHWSDYHLSAQWNQSCRSVIRAIKQIRITLTCCMLLAHESRFFFGVVLFSPIWSTSFVRIRFFTSRKRDAVKRSLDACTAESGFAAWSRNVTAHFFGRISFERILRSYCICVKRQWCPLSM